MPGDGGGVGDYLVTAPAAEVAHGLLDALGQGLPAPLHVHQRGHAKHVLVSVIWGFAPLHELRHSPVEWAQERKCREDLLQSTNLSMSNFVISNLCLRNISRK